jgi:Domain of unknown function (DUF5668)/B-box zinc finger
MNCANHADASAVAYCRTCGKALCASCTRPVRGVIYCEDCLGAKMEGAAPVSPQTPYQQIMDQGLGLKVPPGPATGPNPTVAGILGAIPFGIGAVYNGQYAKGLAHLGIFALLIAGCNSNVDLLPTFCGFGIAFLVLYGIIDAVHSARAIQAGLPAPDPFGLGATFGGGTRVQTSQIPFGAIVLILIGLLFLLNTMGFEFGLHRFWPLILIGLGGWLLARNWGLLGPAGCAGCQCARCRARRLMGPAMLLTIGILFLIESLHVANFGRTWPVILLVIGGVKLLQANASFEGHVPTFDPLVNPNPAAVPVPPAAPVAPVVPVAPVPPTNEVNRG